MRKIASVLIVTLLIAACGPSEEMKRLQAENDSLRQASSTNESAVNDFMEAFNEIEDNLRTIKEREQIIRLNANEEGIEDSVKERINEDILSIYKEMVDNKKKLNSLTKKLKKSNLQTAQFKKMVDNLEAQITERNNEILSLRDQLESLNFDIANLSSELKNLGTDLDMANEENAKKAEIIDQQTEALNTAYYVIGNVKTLKEKGIITKSGLFIGSAKLKENFNRENFTKLDITKISEIELGYKKVHVATSHPSNSYNLVGEKPISKLEITNNNDFWSVSKYLVIVVD